MSDKPVIFISHSSKDKELALVLQEQIANVIGVAKSNVFLSTDSGAIPASSDWFGEIKKNLDGADALVILFTPSSTESSWVNFEIGYFWHKTRGKYIYPVTTPNVQVEGKGPVERLQAKSLGEVSQIEAFFEALINQHGGELTKLDTNAIKEVVEPKPSFAKVQVTGLYGNTPKRTRPRS